MKPACTPSSLGAFAWDLFQRWCLAGFPNKESWAFQQLGWLGDDACARRLAPLLRDWPQQGGHARAVTGLEVLATMGTDVALMHLHGISQKTKTKGLQAAAQEKIALIAEARGLTAEERVLWAHVTKAIAPLRTPAPADDDAATDEAGDEAPLARLARTKSPPQKSAVAPPRVSAPLPPPLAPLGRRMKQRVARGKQDIDGRLDLHGLTQSEAHPALLRFLLSPIRDLDLAHVLRSPIFSVSSEALVELATVARRTSCS